jgi:hypothetical protein
MKYEFTTEDGTIKLECTEESMRLLAKALMLDKRAVSHATFWRTKRDIPACFNSVCEDIIKDLETHRIG